MRSVQVGRLLGGTVLAFVVGAPMASVFAAPDRIQSVPPGRMIGERRAPAQYAPVQQTQAPAQAAPVQAAPVQAAPVQAQAPAPAAQNADSGIDVRGALDKIFGASDEQISQKLRELGASKRMDKSIDRKQDRAAIEQFYAGRNYAPLWIKDGRLTTRAKAAVARLKDAAADGLDAPDYPVPDFANISGAEALAEADVKLTGSTLTFSRHLEAGRIAPTRVLTEVNYGRQAPDSGDLLKTISDAQDINAAFDRLNPPDAGFR